MITDIEKKQRLGRDTSIIIDRLLKELTSPPIAILLYGGYGRGEGAWFRNANENVTPYNDYDIDLITNQDISRERINTIRQELAECVGISWIDLGVVKIEELKKLHTTIQNYDLKYASTLLYGDENIYNEMPDFDKEEIGDSDILTLYKTRMWTLLGSWKGSFRNLTIEEARFFKNQMAKCILASCDMILVSRHDYQPSYKEKAKKAPLYYPDFDQFAKLSTWAINEKLEPTTLTMTEAEMKQLYLNAKKLFFWALKESIGYKSHIFNNPCITEIYYKLNFNHHLHCAYGRYIKKDRIHEKSIDIFLAQNYIVHAIKNDGSINNEFLSKACRLLTKWNYSCGLEWNELREKVAFARNNL